MNTKTKSRTLRMFDLESTNGKSSNENQLEDNPRKTYGQKSSLVALARKMSKPVLAIALACASLSFSVAQTVPYSKGRIAISSDGNEHDKDDWAATPFSLALLAAKDLQNKVVLYTFSDHVWGSNHDHSDARAQMRESALVGGQKFGFTSTNFIEAAASPNAAYSAMTAEINKSTANDPLTIIAAGPMEVVGRAIDAANESKLQYVRVISHSNWNDNHADRSSGWENHNGWTWNEIQNKFQSKGLTMDHIVDQNGGNGYDGMRANKAKFSWLNTSAARNQAPYQNGAWAWLYNRQVAAQKGSDFDPSDAGMIIYLLTGKEKTDPSDAKAIMENPTSGGNTGGNGGQISDISDLSAQATGCNQIKLTWSDVAAEQAYRVRRKTPSTGFVILADVAAGSTSYTDNLVNGNTTYIYQVRPMQNGKAVKKSNRPRLTTPSCSNEGQLSDISDLEVSVTNCPNVKLTWSDVGGETAYRIRRKKPNENVFTNLTDVPANTESYVDNSAQAGQSYIYMVRPVEDGQAVKISNQPTISIPNCGGNRESDSHILIQPNPFENEFVFQLDGEAKDINAALYDGRGAMKAVVISSITNNKYKVNTEELDAGIYYLRVTTLDGLKTIRVLKL